MNQPQGLREVVEAMENWRERALIAEAEVAKLQRKLKGERKRNDPRHKAERRLKKRKQCS